MISADRVQKRLDEIYACGAQNDGTHSRIAFGSEDKRGREIFISYLNKLGLTAKQDLAGNLIARWDGRNPDLPPIMMGSHLDTVPNGGKFDGAYGCVGALEVVEALMESGERLYHPIEIIVFADEEGVRFGKGLSGSNAISGQPLIGFHAEDCDAQGKSRREVMGGCGIDFDRMQEAARKKEEVACFLEMHVEQGRALEKAEKKIGVVTAIAGVSRFQIIVTGETNHSGSTMMPDRKDALVGAAGFISQIPEIVARCGSEYAVGTVGRIAAVPGSVNVIPGKVEFTLEVREQTDESRALINSSLFAAMDKICEKSGLQYEARTIADYACAPMDAGIVETIDKICAEAGYSHCRMPSGAFHDAMFMTRSFPTGMIFVPSRGGISHSPLEFTAPEDIQAGCEVLYRTVKELDKSLQFSS
ncbi:MAG: Zn-dependent hydrolase [Lachnospiraceae bacterium]|nr:Zn-dependent hydrolase [Lachnospiraceae bacterium]